MRFSKHFAKRKIGFSLLWEVHKGSDVVRNPILHFSEERPENFSRRRRLDCRVEHSRLVALRKVGAAPSLRANPSNLIGTSQIVLSVVEPELKLPKGVKRHRSRMNTIVLSWFFSQMIGSNSATFCKHSAKPRFSARDIKFFLHTVKTGG